MKTIGTTLFVAAPTVLAAFLAFEQPARASQSPASEIPAPTSESPDVPALVWSDKAQERTVAAGEQKAEFVFWATNASTRSVLIVKLHTSCGCTVAKLEKLPFELVPGAQVPVQVNVKLHGKEGTVTRRVTVETSEGPQQLIVKAHVPDQERTKDASDKSSPARQAAVHDLSGLGNIQPNMVARLDKD